MFVKDELEHDQHDEHTTPETASVVGAESTTDQGTETDDSSAGEETRNDSDPQEDETSEQDENEDSATTFSRSYVEKLRRESAGYREKANRSDELEARLHTALVAATGKLQDPTDLGFDLAHLDDEDALNTAIDDLLSKKPHLASRRPFGDVGQGNRGKSSEGEVNLLDIMKAHA